MRQMVSAPPARRPVAWQSPLLLQRPPAAPPQPPTGNMSSSSSSCMGPSPRRMGLAARSGLALLAAAGVLHRQGAQNGRQVGATQ